MVFAPLMGRRPKRRKRESATRECMTPGCGMKIAAWKWLCDPCFAALPYLRKKEICAARADRAPQRVFGLSKAAAEWLAEQRSKLAGE